MAIRGIESMSLEELGDELARGGRFVTFPYCISVLIVTFRRSSDVHFVRKGQSTIGLAAPYLAISLVCGWWGLPWGPIWTIGSLLTILTGGKDHTEEMLSAMPLARAYRDGRGGEDNDTAYLDDRELEEAANRVALLLSEVNHIREAAGRYYQSLSPGDLDDVIAAIEDSTEWAESEQHPRGALPVVRVFAQTLHWMLLGLEATAERDRYETQRALAQAREGLELLEAAHERLNLALQSRRERRRRRSMKAKAADHGRAGDDLWPLYGLALGVGAIILILLLGRVQPAPPRPPTAVPPTATSPLVATCDASIRGCVDVPASWSWEALEDDAWVGCETMEGGWVAVSVTDYVTPPALQDLADWLLGDLSQEDSGWRNVTPPIGENRYPGNRVCLRVGTYAQRSADDRRARVFYYLCTLDTHNTMHIFAVRPVDTRQPSDEDLNAVVISHR